MAPARHQAHASLQTKLLTNIVLILIVVLGASSFVNYYRASQSNKHQGEKQLQLLYTTFENILAQSSRQFEGALSTISPEQLQTAQNKSSLELLSEFSGIRLVQTDGRILTTKSVSNTFSFPNAIHHKQAIVAITRNPSPYTRIYCEDSCYQSSYVPVITADGKFLIINGVRPLEAVIQSFSRITGADIALIHREDNQPTTVFLASHATTIQPLLDKYRASSDLLNSVSPHYLPESLDTYLAQNFLLTRDITTTPLSAVIVANDSYRQQLTKTILKDSLIASLVALIAATLLIFFAFRTTLKKLVNLSTAIPKLSESKFTELKQALFPYIDKAAFTDEVDQVNLAVFDVASALENMERSVAKHRSALVTKIAELKEAQSFNDVLVNHSPLVIVAHTLNGDIKMLNHHGRKLSGWRENEVGSKTISDLILPDLSGNSISDLLYPLIKGHDSHIQTEQLMIGPGSQVHDLTWLHAAVDTKESPLILSVGLDITERRKTESRLRWLSNHDNVTNLLNREAFYEESKLLIQQYAHSHRVDFLMVDIDKFSTINDMYGFQNGDTVLNEAARYLERQIPYDTIIARTGPNEFAALVVMEHSEVPGDNGALHPLNDKHLRFFSVLNDEAIEVVLSGVLAHHPDDGRSIDELMVNASAALRELAAEDRGRITRLVESYDARAQRQERMQIHDEIVKALTEERFVLLYQPIYDLHKGCISHCESLVRLKTEDGDLISPAGFMDVAKENGLMPRLDLLVMRMAMEQLARWSSVGIDLKLSVNTTAATFESDKFIKVLKSLFLETGAPPSRLIFEIVETEAINNLSAARKLCERLTALNIQIAFDDFGIGFTSFEYLRDLPVDYIKIDQSFIRYLYDRKSDQLLVKSMVDMAHALGKKVIAEGVEDGDSMQILENMGVHYLQGYYISRPIPAEDLNLSFKLKESA